MRPLVMVLLFVFAGCVDLPPSGEGAPDGSTEASPDGGRNDAGNDFDAGTADAGTATAVLRVHYPAGGKSISVRGSGAGLSWTQGVPLSPGADDVWTITLSEFDSTLEWKPLLDDQTWSRGPNYHVAPGQTVDVYPHFNAAKGTVTKLYADFTSAFLPDPRDVWVYLPPAYNENTRARLPVVYMHDGQNLFDPALAFGGNEWKVDEAFDFAAENGTCDSDPAKACQNDDQCPGSACHTFEAAIVIGVGNTSARIDEYTPTSDASYGGGNGANYLKMLATELKPAVDQALRTRGDRESTIILGSSLGGLISAWAGLEQPTVWGRVGAMSPSTWWDDRYLIGAVQDSADAPLKPSRVYVDCGDSGTSNDGVTDTTALAQAYREVGYMDDLSFQFVIAPGHQHNETYWAQRFPGAMRFLLDPRP